MCGKKVSLVISIHSNAVPNRGYWNLTKTFQEISSEFNIVCYVSNETILFNINRYRIHRKLISII